MCASGPIGPEMASPPRARGERGRRDAFPLRFATLLAGGAAAGSGWASPLGATRGGARQGASAWSKSGLRPVDFLLVALFAIVLRAPSMSLSVFGSADESAFILAGREVVLGHLPYLTFWDHKPLGSTLLIASAMAAFGQSLEAVRALGMACVIGTAWTLCLITRRFSQDRLVPLAAALLYVAFSTRLAGGIATITEVILAPFTAAGVLLLLLAPGRRSSLGVAATFAAAGLAFGIATWIKYVPAIPAALTGFVALAAVLVQGERGFGRTAACGAGFAAGLLFPTVASIVGYWWLGALDAFWPANFGFMARYATEAGFNDHPRGAFFYALRCTTLVVLDIWPLAVAATAAFLPACLRHLFDRGQSYGGALIVAWLVGEMLAVAMQMKFYMYHFLPLLPPLCALSAIAIREHAGRLVLPQKVGLVAVLAVAFTAFGPIALHARAVAAALSRPDVPREIAKLVAPEMRPGDRMFIPNYEPIIYFLAKTPLPTPFAFPVLLAGPHMSVIPVDPRAEVRGILDGKPRFIVFNTSWRDAPVTWDPELMEVVERIVTRDYVPRSAWTLAESMGTVRLFALRD